MKKLRTAVIGLGRIGWEFHLPEIAKNDKFELVGVVDSLSERVAEVREKYGVQGYTDYADMFQEQRPDLTVIASPTPFHAEQAIAAFKAGSHVFCEKPVGRSSAEFQCILKTAVACGKKFMTYQPHRVAKEVIALKGILSQEKIGPIYMMRRNWFDYIRRNDWQSVKEYGGGMLRNFGSHFIDQLLYLTEYKAKVVSCVARNLITLGDAEDFVKILLETAGEIILDIEINLASAHIMPTWQILGAYGSIILDAENQVWKVKYCRPEEFSEMQVKPSLAAEGRKYRNDEQIKWLSEDVSFKDVKSVCYYDNCYDYFADDGAPLVAVEQTCELLRILEECSIISEASRTTSEVSMMCESMKRQPAKRRIVVSKQ